MHEFKKTNDVAQHEDALSHVLRQVRKSAFAGAASVIPLSRIDVLEDIASNSLLEIARRYGETGRCFSKFHFPFICEHW